MPTFGLNIFLSGKLIFKPLKLCFFLSRLYSHFVGKFVVRKFRPAGDNVNTCSLYSYDLLLSLDFDPCSTDF